jgi:hypothetical protein
MHRASALAFGLVTSIVLAGAGASRAEDAGAKANDKPARVAAKDFGRLSQDGVSAFDDIHQARIALFDGAPDEAAKLISDARASLDKAKTDNTAFTKAEAALHPPAKAPQAQSHAPKSTTPVAWIPISGEVDYGETYVATPEKARAMVEANKSLKRGEGAKALETIRLASVDVDYVLALAPLEQSISYVDQAGKLMATHDYYGAGEALRKAEAGVRLDEVEDVANVRNGAKAGGTTKK